MDKELVKKWVAALRSGEYKQTDKYLHHPQEESFCCLGVLCAVVAGDRSYTAVQKVASKDGFYRFTNGSLYNDELLDSVGAVDMAYDLMRMNDQEGKTFPEIADYIEKELLSDDATTGQ